MNSIIMQRCPLVISLGSLPPNNVACRPLRNVAACQPASNTGELQETVSGVYVSQWKHLACSCCPQQTRLMQRWSVCQSCSPTKLVVPCRSGRQLPFVAAPGTTSSTNWHLGHCVGKSCVQDVIGAPLKDALQALLPAVQGLQVATADISSQCSCWASRLPIRHSLHQTRAADIHRRGADELSRPLSKGTAAEAPPAAPGPIATRLSKG